MILLCWFNSDTIIEYAKLLEFERPLKIYEYENKKLISETPLTYPRFLRMSFDGFFIKLITCPICLTVWLTFIIGIFSVILLPFVSLLVFGFGWVISFIWLPTMIVLTLPMTSIGTLGIYGTLTRLLHLQ